MMKRTLLFCMLIINIMLSHNVTAKTKECLVTPSYDIFIHQNFVQVVNESNNLIIKPSGLVTLNDNSVKMTPVIQKEAKQFQAYLRKQLPIFERDAYGQLDHVRAAFETAIREKLGNKSELLKHLNNLHAKLASLLHKSILTKDGVTYFYHQPFNNIRKDGEEIGEQFFYKILGDSVLNFNIFKNYSAIKKIAKQEWKEQKVGLKLFDEQVCQFITQIDNKYSHLIIGLN